MTAEQTAERASRVKKGERGRKEPLHLSGGNGRKEGRKDQGRSVVTVIQIREIEGERGRLHCTALLPCHAPAAPPIPLPPLALPPSLPALLGRIANFTSGCMHDFGAGRACMRDSRNSCTRNVHSFTRKSYCIRCKSSRGIFLSFGC